jgi:hypothetical protein
LVTKSKTTTLNLGYVKQQSSRVQGKNNDYQMELHINKLEDNPNSMGGGNGNKMQKLIDKMQKSVDINYL